MVLACVLASVACVRVEPGSGRSRAALDVCTASDDGALCDDGHPCTVNDVCLNKICVGTPVADGTACTDGDFCTTGDTCLNKICVGTPAPDGYPCTDENLCTDPDRCQAGKCVPGPVRSCDDGDPCTIDMCDPITGCASTAHECVPPPDAVADVITDVGADDMSMPDGTTGPDAPDAGDADADAGAPDTGDDAGPDAPVDAGVEVAEDAGSDVSEDGAPDATDGGQPDEPPTDGGEDGVVSPHDFRAHGGACSCTIETPPRSALPLALAAVAALLSVLRRRAR